VRFTVSFDVLVISIYTPDGDTKLIETKFCCCDSGHGYANAEWLWNRR